jgi:hypothetical protein
MSNRLRGERAMDASVRLGIGLSTMPAMEAENQSLRRKCDEISQLQREKHKKLLQIQELYDKVRWKAEAGQMEKAASEAVDISLRKVSCPSQAFGGSKPPATAQELRIGRIVQNSSGNCADNSYERHVLPDIAIAPSRHEPAILPITDIRSIGGHPRLLAAQGIDAPRIHIRDPAHGLPVASRITHSASSYSGVANRLQSGPGGRHGISPRPSPISGVGLGAGLRASFPATLLDGHARPAERNNTS